MTTPKLNASSRIMYEEAQKMGISCQTFSDPETILMTQGDQQWYVRGSRTSLQSSVGKTIADFKPLTKDILTHFQIPTAKHVVIKHERDLQLLQKLTFPIVMKPLAERHGKGVVVGIKSIEEATELFRKNESPFLCEEMLRGTEYRIVCVDYKFVAAAFRKPAHVVGDDKNTILQLIEVKNSHPWRGSSHENYLTKIEVDESMEKYVNEQGLTMNSVPALSQEVFLRKTANLSTGGEAWDVTNQVSEENRFLFEKIARACDLNVIGIDMMCESLEKPITKQPYAGVIEVNASPGLRMHHYPVEGTPRNVAKSILDMVLTQLQSK